LRGKKKIRTTMLSNRNIIKKYQTKILGVFSLFLFTLCLPALVHTNESRFFYDELGRLQAEVEPQGNTAIYNYDAVGNLLSITRSDVSPTGVSITYFNPEKGTEGIAVEIFGSGFIAVAADNQVDFNGTSATVTESSSTRILASVPLGATTGPIQVTNVNGSATSANDFVVTQPITVSVFPSTYILAAGGTRQFTAMVIGTTNTDVIWSVKGSGSISDSGLYTAPGTIDTTANVIVEARSKADFKQFGTASIDILPPGSLGPVLSPHVSVKVDPAPIDRGPFISPMVSVEILGTSNGPVISPFVSVSLFPMITNITPTSGTAGTFGLNITLTGTGLTGATGLSFLLDGNPDTDITVSNIVVNGTGTQLTATFDIAGTAVSGTRVVRVITPNGTSPATTLEGNGFSVN